MSKIEVLKEQARRHEQKEEWRKALDLYQRAIERLAEEDDPDIGLYNRVGDLFIRVGEVGPAVEALEQAVELYVDAELPNNAIAVCKKILRNVPDRHAVFLRMGQIRAHQGFLVDARTHFLTYAERMQSAGELDEALRALVEFADAAPDDVDIRLSIAEHFQQHERESEAVEQLVAGYRSASRQDLAEVVQVFVERLAEIRPGVDPAALAAEAGGGDVAVEFVGATDDSAAEGWDFGDATPLDDAVDDPVADSVAAAGDEEAATEESSPAGSGVDARGEAIEEARTSAGEPDDVGEVPVGDALSSLGPDVSRFVRRPEGGNPLEGLDVVDEDVDDYDEEEDLDVELPFLHVPADGPGEADDVPELPSLDDADAPAGGSSWADALFAAAGDRSDASAADEGSGMAGEASELAGEASELAGEASERGDQISGVADETSERIDAGGGPADALEDAPAEDTSLSADELARRIADAPDDLELRQRAVEFAHRSGDDRALADAYVGLGEALRRTGADARAQAVFREALQLDPDHPAARAALASASVERREVAEVASNEDYVDLGALILGEDDEKTTRFVVAYEEPSGDEQADFVKMLSQFKAKVAENVDASDVTAHHDLGTAYKEMGLLDEAVEEFQAALRASADHLPTYEMLGQTFLERGTPETAVRVLSRALEAPYEVEDELLGIYYYMGRSHEECGNKEQALEFYERVFSLDINFADVTERLRALR